MAFTIYVGDTSPLISYPITESGVAQDLTGATAKFYMRSVDGSLTPVINGVTATIPSPTTGGIVEYLWASGDTTTAGAGKYRGWFVITLSGGAVQTAPEFDIQIVDHSGSDSVVTTDLCTVDDVRNLIELATSSYDALIQDAISAASIAISNRCGRQFVPQLTGVTRRFQVNGRRVNLYPFDLRTATTVTLNPTSSSPQVIVAGTDYALGPVAGALGSPLDGSAPISLKLFLSNNRTFSSDVSDGFGFGLIDIVGNWGSFATISAVPRELRRACAIAAAAWLDRAISQYALHDQGDARDIRPDMTTTWGLPAASYRLFEPYIRPVV